MPFCITSWGADLIEWGVILVEVNFYHSLSSQLKSVNNIKNRPWFTSYTCKASEMWRE
jgi:hypothetical protein